MKRDQKGRSLLMYNSPSLLRKRVILKDDIFTLPELKKPKSIQGYKPGPLACTTLTAFGLPSVNTLLDSFYVPS